jgi:hypothetical protein
MSALIAGEKSLRGFGNWQMANEKILIFGAESAPRSGSVTTLGARIGPSDTLGLACSRVPVEATAANLKAVMEQVSNLVRAAKDAVGELGIVYVDVGLAIAADGSVGLLGTAASTSAKGTLTVRLQV